jgi:hypothetical protein
MRREVPYPRDFPHFSHDGRFARGPAAPFLSIRAIRRPCLFFVPFVYFVDDSTRRLQSCKNHFGAHPPAARNAMQYPLPKSL